MDSEIVIKVENLSKVYSLHQPKVDENGNIIPEHWALKDVSFEIRRGETVGITGPNGSGKSTLLKILAGVTKPTAGKIIMRGKVASILDIGAGFHPELSGRENVFLNGQIHGFTKKEIESKFDEIVAFSGIEKFIDEPVKNYSNGMYLRLAFSIMTHLDFDVYLLDEVLSVGDLEFGYTIRQKIDQLKREKKTLIIVSHNLSEIQSADTFVLMQQGSIKSINNKANILSDYSEKAFAKNFTGRLYTNNCCIKDFTHYKISAALVLKKVELLQDSGEKENFKTNKEFILNIEFDQIASDQEIYPILNIKDLDDNTILSSAYFISKKTEIQREKGNYKWTCVFPANLFNAQSYKICLIFIKSVIEDRRLVSQENEVEKIGALDDVLIFKAELNSTDYDYSELNLPGNLFMGFEWNLDYTKDLTK